MRKAPDAPDRLTLASLRLMAHIGVTEEERRERQRLELDLELYADLDQAGRSGDLHHTIDYRQAADAVRALLEGRPWHLVEAAALATLGDLLERFPQAGRAVVRVRKYVLPETSYVEVQMERRR
jgi:7,8-dihydroneopterin aldolase/epimerase/oxygenase